MPADASKLILAAAFAPYLALAAYDGWLHEKARRVPKLEQALHATIFVAVVALLTALFRGPAWLAWPALALFALAGAADEFGFHAPLERRERRLHHAAYACFAGFVGVALATGALGWPMP